MLFVTSQYCRGIMSTGGGKLEKGIVESFDLIHR